MTGSGQLANHVANSVNHEVIYFLGPFCVTIVCYESDISHHSRIQFVIINVCTWSNVLKFNTINMLLVEWQYFLHFDNWYNYMGRGWEGERLKVRKKERKQMHNFWKHWLMGIIMSSLWCSNHGCWISMNDMKENGQIFCVSEQL